MRSQLQAQASTQPAEQLPKLRVRRLTAVAGHDNGRGQDATSLPVFPG